MRLGKTYKIAPLKIKRKTAFAKQIALEMSDGS